jgi:hypothetical protein
MPYITKEKRERFRIHLKGLKKLIKTQISVGELNYLLTSLCNFYLESKKECYQTYNDILGSLECSKQEYYRKNISKYEDIKEIENGPLELFKGGRI